MPLSFVLDKLRSVMSTSNEAQPPTLAAEAADNDTTTNKEATTTASELPNDNAAKAAWRVRSDIDKHLGCSDPPFQVGPAWGAGTQGGSRDDEMEVLVRAADRGGTRGRGVRR